MFATALLDADSEFKKPDLESHSLIRFLDKFVYRNAKAADSTRGTSLMQPVKVKKDLGDIWLGSRGTGAAADAVNSPAFWKKKAEDVAAEDVFFHEYFQHVAKEPKPAAASAPADDEEAHEDEIWKALVAAQPDVEGDGSEDGFDDLDEEDMASDGDSEPELALDSDMDDDMSMFSDAEDGEEEGSDGLVQVEAEEEEEEDDKKKNTARSRRKALKALPMFASVDDYAELLAQEEEGV